MKKLLTILAVAAALAAVSCTKEREMNGDNGPMASVSFTVNSAELMTKADPGYGKATAIDQLLVQVFNKVGDDFVKLESPEVNITTNPGTPASWTVDMKLAKNETYKIAFWAQKSETGIYGTSDLSAVTVDYSKIAINNDNADAFCAARLVTVTGSLSQTVYLYRPLAQINIGTNDLAAYKNSVPTAKKNLTATITLPVETPNKLNVIGGTESEGVVKSAVTGTTTEEVVFTTAPDYVMSGKDITSSSVSYDYLTMLYVLAAPDKETMTFKAKLNNGSTDVSDLTVSNMPYQANYRTNIVGQLLTGSFEYNVEIEEGFYADYEKLVSPTFASLAELNTYLAGLKENTSDGDHGDINPEQVTLTALGTVSGTPQIVLPKINGGVDIRLAFEHDGTMQIVYADPADGAKKPANIFFYAQKLDTLKATVPSSHFELLSGSVVTNKAIVSTNTTTFVIQNGAKVGTAEIQKGNATIAGTVTTVSVPTGAKADDDNNPVQVFLEKVSAVDKIILEAKTDVVVEQPKDQIEVEATEKKVAVYVNSGANNSTATAQNGGVIYVEANVPCTVTADGTSEAEDGSAASSTVIINDGAGGSSVSAENGAAINVTANDDCEVSAAGTSTPEDPTEDAIPSSVTISGVSGGAEVSAVESQGGEVNVSGSVDPSAVDVKEGVALIGKVVYLSLSEAVAAAESGDTITLIGDDKVSLTDSGEIEIDKPLTITGKVNAQGEPLHTIYGTPTYSSGTYNDIFITSTSGTVKISNINFREFSNEVAGSAHGRAVLFVSSNNKAVVIENVTISEINTEAIHINGGSFTIEGCLIDCAKDEPAAGSFSRGIVATNAATGSIANTDISNVYSSNSGSWTAAIELLGEGPIAISDCNLGADEDGYTMGIAAGAAGTVTPGTSTVTVSNCSVSAYYALFGDGDSGAQITVSSGEYEGFLCEGDNGTGLTITGGKYTSDPADFLTAGLEANLDGDGWWNVGPAVWSGAVASDDQFAASVDETAKTVTVSSTAVLAKLAANVQAGNDYAGYKITLTKDMDLDNQEWTPIGGKGKNFAGEFDGGGHTISNLKITRGYADVDLNWRVGFIGSAIGAKVHGLTIHNANVTARGEVAAAVGYNAYSVEGKPSEIYDVNVTGHVVISAAHRGAAAICGYSNYYIHDCTVNVDSTSLIDGFWASGGIVGFSPQSGDIKNNYSNIKVVSDYACGGIVGLIEDSVEISGNTVENTTLQASANYGIGGLIGMMNYGTGLKIKNNTVSNVAINATENVAGVIGAVWADYGTGAVEITNNTITGITINSSKGDGTAAFIGYIESDRTATISGNSIQGTINTAKALVNEGIWAGVTDASKVVASNNTMNIEINVAE